MATTIKLKNGSGAPLAGDLVQGEPALDLTNKRLYTEDSGGSVIEVGTSPSTIDINAGTIDGTVIGGASAAAGTFTTFTSTGIDDNATSTAITIDASENVGIGTTSPDARLESLASSAGSNIAKFADPANNRSLIFSASSAGSIIKTTENTDEADADRALIFQRGATETMRIDASGDVGIGETSPALALGSSGTVVQVTSNDRAAFRAERTSGGGDIEMRAFGGGGASLINHGTGELQVGTNGSEAMRIDSSGSVGIGTSSPSELLHVSGSGGVYGRITETNTSGTVKAGLILERSSTNTDFLIENSGNLTFSTASDASTWTERMRIDSSGNVGIGTSSPAQKLHLSASSGSVYNQATSGAVEFYSGIGSSGLGSVQSNTSLTFVTGSSYAERMRIDSSGNLLVGKTSLTSATDGVQLEPVGSVVATRSSNPSGIFRRNTTDGAVVWFINQSGGISGSVSISGGTVTYNTASDVRLKENIVDAPAGNIDAIRVRSFDWKADGTHQTYGMVAQELVDVAPEAVSQGETEDDMWGVDYSKLVPMMIKEIQDLKAEVAALKGA